MDYHLTILLFAFVAGTFAGPAGPRSPETATIATCSKACTANSKFNYAPGTTYEYKYEAETRTSMLGASEDHSTIGITAIAVVEVHSKCELVLKIRDVSIFASDSKQYKDQDVDGKFAKTLEKYPLRFSFQDGSIESVCPNENDVSWAVNIKKGLLSAFQNSMDNFQTPYSGSESDVTGKCDTEYKIAHQAWRSTSIKKTKDISGCTHRQGYTTAIQTAPFRISSGMKSVPILKSTQECDQEVNIDGTLLSTLCHEMHMFHPFSKDNNGATTEVTQKLNFIQDKQGITTQKAVCGTSQPLHFEHTQVGSQTDMRAADAIQLLKEICRQTVNEVKLETPRQFAMLVFTMKRIDFPGLRRVYNQVVKKAGFCSANAERIRKFAIDAIPMVGTDASVQLMKTLISNNDVTGAQADMWLASLAFLHDPTMQMIGEVGQLLHLPSLSAKVLLPLSTMVHSYCRVNPLCEEVREVRDFIQHLEMNIQDGCRVTQQNFRNIMMSLRALGNTGRAQMAVPSLYNCISNQDNPMDIKVAAVQAFRRLSCATDRNNLMGILRNTDEDSELRIAAYLAIMQCPSSEFISQIKQTLATEEVNQVGSFMWSHLTNLMESSDPANKLVQQLLGDDVLDKEFDLEKMKFSRNYEASLYIDRLKTGAKIDSNLVWSSKSFVPRSTSLNLTFNLLGESVNLFELGGRVEGLETLLESYMGPAGYFNNENKDGSATPLADPKHAKLSSNKLNGIHNKAQTKMTEVRGAMYMRMFGNELSYNMFGTNNGVDNDFSGSDMFDFLQKMRNNEQQDFSITKSFMFLDSTYTVPTISGLPVSLRMNGTATVALNAGGHVDMKNPGTSIVIEGNFEPSAAVEIDSMMSVDAFITRGGLKMVSTLHTSTGAKGKIELTNGNVFDMSFDLTKEKTEILDVKTAFFMVYDEVMTEQRMITAPRLEKSMCSGDRLMKITGLQFCASVSTPNSSRSDAPDFPLTGPVSVSVALHKRDIPNGYKLEAKTIKTPVQTLFRFLSDTPGSQEDRAIGLDVDVKLKERTLNVNLASPWKKATLKGELIDTSSMKGLIGNINIDDNERIYNLDAKIIIDRTKDRMTYTPTVSLEIPNRKKIQLSGVLNYQVEYLFDADLIITGAIDHDITFQTSIMNTPKSVGAKANLKYQQGDGYVFSALSQRKIEKRKLTSKHSYQPRLYVRTPTEELVELTGNVEFVEGKSLKIDAKLDKITKSPITLKADLIRVENAKKKRVKYACRMNIQGPKLSSKITFIVDNQAWKNVFNKVRWDYNLGKGRKDTIVLSNRIKMTLFKNKKIVKLTSNLNSLRNNDIDGSLVATFNHNKMFTNLNAAVLYGKNMKDKATKERLDLSLTAKHKTQQSKIQIDYTVGFKLPAKDINVTVTGGYMHDGKSIETDVNVRYHPERMVNFGIKLHNRTNLYPNYAGEISISLPQEREMSFAGAFGRESEDKYISNLEFEVIKGRRTRIDTMLKIATERVYEVEVGVKLPELEPVRVTGGFTREDHGFSTEASFSRGPKLYKFLTQAHLDREKEGKLMVEVSVPSRRVNMIVAGSQYKTERQGMIDIQWDADNNIDDRFLTNVTLDIKNWDDFEVATTLHYPSRTIIFTMKHSAASRYITNVELSWSPKEQLEFNIIFRDDEIDGAKRNELSVEFTSPFAGYEDLGLAVSLLRDSLQYQTKSSITWAKKKKILISATSKVPFTLATIDMVGTIETPFKQYENLIAMIKHRLDDELQTKMLVQWGRQKLSLDAVGQLQYTKASRSLNSNLDIRTPFEGLRIFVLNVQHNDDLRKFASKVSIEMSQYYTQPELSKYLVAMDMTHDKTLIALNNKGTLQITIPNDDITTMWEIAQQQGSTHALLDILPKRGNRFKVAFDETHQLKPNRKLTSSFHLIIPTEEVKDLFISFNHEDKPSYVKTGVSISKDNLNVYKTDLSYSQYPGSVVLNSEITSMYIDDVKLKLTSSHSLMPYRGYLDFQWAPGQKIFVDTSMFYNNFGMFDSSVKLSTPFERAGKIVLLSKRERNGLNWKTKTELDFGPRQKISFDAVYRFDHVKLTQISIKTPFPQFPGLDTSFRVEGNPINFHGEADFDMQPYVGKTTANYTWAYYHGTSLTGAFNLQTPFPQYPYMKVKVNSNNMGVSRVSGIELEYLPTQVLKIETDYRFTALETLEGNVKVTSPYTDNKQLQAGFIHIGNREEFRTKATITCECINRPVLTEATFSSKEAITSTFVMDSPFRGYQTVKWNFNHKGKINDFHTTAEYETNGQKMSYENSFSMKDTIQGQLTFLTPFITLSRTHFLFSHAGDFPNTKTHTEAAFNEKMIKSDVELSHNPQWGSSVASAVITTPFERYETVNAKVLYSGDRQNFTAAAKFQYDQEWQASWRHTFDGQDLLSSAIFNSPYLEDEVNLQFNHTGNPLNFENILEYTIGPSYRTTSQSKFLYNIDTLSALAKSTTVIGEETRLSFISLNSNQTVSANSMNVDISSKFLAQIRQKDVSINFSYKHAVDEQKMEITTYTVVELPFEDYDSNKFYYHMIQTRNEQNGNMEITSSSKWTFDTPLLEPYSSSSEQMYDSKVFKQTEEYSYGQKKVVAEQYFDFKSYSYRVTTPFEGYENHSIDVNFNGNLWQHLWQKEDPRPAYNYRHAQNGLISLDTVRSGAMSVGVDSTITSSALPSPIEVEYLVAYELTDKTVIDYKSNFRASYSTDKEIKGEQKYSPGVYSMKMSTPYEGYEQTEVDVSYKFDPTDKVGGDISVVTSALDMPIKASVSSKYVSLKDMEFLSSFSSGFTEITNIEAELRSSVLGATYKPVFKLTWEDSERNEDIFEVDGTWTWKYPESGNVHAGVGLMVHTPFAYFTDLNIQYDHEHSTSPMRAKEIMLVQYNNTKYLDVDAEFGALSKFTGAVNFRAPRNMEFSFSGVNEGESVDVDLVLNWNKDEQKSLVRFQFDLADTGDFTTEKKVFNVRLIQPSRVVNIHNSYQKTDDKVVSVGDISWNKINVKDASYDLEFSKQTPRGMTIHESSIKIMVPTRTVEMSGSYTDKGGQKIGTGSLLWDAQNDRNKQLGVKVVLAPYDVRKMAQLDITLPSMNKELSLKTDMAVNDGTKLLDGQAQFMYSLDTEKTVMLKYFINKDGSEKPNYSAGWYVDHVQTKTHLEMSSSLTHKDALSSGDVQLQYLTNRGNLNTMVFHSELDKAARELNIKITTPDDTAEIVGHVTENSPYIMTVQGTRNAKSVWETVWKVDTLEHTLDASLSYADKKKQIKTSSFFPNATSFVSETNRQVAGETIQEGHMSSELNQRLLHGHLKWRPQLVQDVASFSGDALKQITSEVSSVMDGGAQGLSKEILIKYRTIVFSMMEELAPVTNLFEEEVQLIEKELKAMKKELKRMYKQNEMYLQSLDEMYSGTVKQMLAGYSSAITGLRENYDKVAEKIQEITNKIDTYPFQECYNDMVKQVTEGVDKCQTKMLKEIDIIFATLTQNLEKLTALYNKAIEDVSVEVKQYIVVLIDELALTPYIDDLKAMYDKLKESYPNLDLQDLDVHKILNEVHQLFIDALEKSSLSDKYQALYKRTKLLLGDQFGDVMDKEDMKELYQAILDLYEQVSWIYKFNDMDTELIQKLLTHARETVMSEFNQLPLGLLDLHKSRFTTFDIENGEIEFDLYLPIPMENFEKLLRFSFEKHVLKLKKMADKYFPRRDICLWDIYYQMPPVQWMNKDWIPPFDAFATVSGKEHYTTFDGRHFDLAGLCSYILVEDLENRNFTVVQKYSGSAKNLVRDSLVVMVHGKTVEMSRNFMVTVDGKPTELPYIADNLHIIRKGYRVILESKLGLDIISDFTSDYHIVGLNGWYHGKVGGLLGTYDNEQHNDMMTPEGTVATTEQKFLNSWEVSKSCRSRKNYATRVVTQKSAECEAVFDKTQSSLRPCFLQVKPDHFQHSCDLEPSRLCDIANLYVHTCAKNAITVSIPQSCVRCEAHDNTEFLSNETLRFESKSSDRPLQKSMDIVFVVEERQCNRDVAGKLKDVIYQMEETLKKSGVSDNQYSLIGYAGSQVDSHTMQGQLFNDASKFAMGLENLRFGNLGPYSDPLGAIMYSTTLKFRTAVTKTVILVSCSPCEEAESYSYNSLSSQLQQRDITLHVLRQNGFQLKTNRSPKSLIYGLDNREVFMGRIRGNENDLFSEMDIPADYCASIALQTNGSIFDASNMVRDSIRQQQAFMNVLADRVGQVDSISKCQACSCELDQTGSPQSVCRRCSAKPVYIKQVPDVLTAVVNYKNQLVQKLQEML